MHDDLGAVSYDSQAGVWEVAAPIAMRWTLRRSAVIGGTPPWVDGEDPGERFAVVDAGVMREFGRDLEEDLGRDRGLLGRVVIEPSEMTKRIDAVRNICSAVNGSGIGRRGSLIAIGGGIVGDLGRFAAAIMRGRPVIQVPTTLVGMIDESVGAKCLINEDQTKNGFGVYAPPQDVYLDQFFLKGCSKGSIAEGLAEVLKVAECVDADLFEILEVYGPELLRERFQHSLGWGVIARAITGILVQVGNDPTERNLARWPDHGHTLGPTLEMVTKGAVSHGRAVAIDSVFSACLSHVLKLVSSDQVERIATATVGCGLPIWHDLMGDPAFLAEALVKTKRNRGGRQSWPVLTAIGAHRFAEPEFDDVLIAARMLADLAAV